MFTRAIAREKQLKGWLRAKKIALIVANNPDWKDLSEEWGQPVEPFRGPEPKKQWRLLLCALRRQNAGVLRCTLG